jgi:hypothetical protein
MEACNVSLVCGLNVERTLMRSRYREEFEKDGVDLVRGNVESHPYKPVEKQQAAKLWLRQQDSTVKRGYDRETIEIARSAKNAAWWAMGISILALIVSILALKSP